MIRSITGFVLLILAASVNDSAPLYIMIVLGIVGAGLLFSGDIKTGMFDRLERL